MNTSTSVTHTNKFGKFHEFGKTGSSKLELEKENF